ncbi:MAG: nucleotidyl transferase AbiEii/AbiGii toxin family protein [Candidatus Xenobiia bacterium LiM19]
MSDQSIAHLLAPLAALQSLIDRFDSGGIIIGGVAFSILAYPRFTADADAMLLLPMERLEELLIAARECGCTPRISDVEIFARKHRVVLLRHEQSGINIDISLGILPFESEAVKRSRIHEIHGVSLRLPSVEDLIIMKAVAHRQKDIIDIQALVEHHQKIDRAHIKETVMQFAEVLEMPELWTDIAPLILYSQSK